MTAYHMTARLVIAAALLSWVVLLTGCGARAGSSPHTSTSRAAAGGVVTGGHRNKLAAQYMVIARAGNRRLEDDFDPLGGRDRDHLAAARADVRDAAATERLFDRRLLRIRFGPGAEHVARRLYRINQLRAKLTAAVAESTSLRSMHAYEPLLRAANAPVEEAVRTIRRELGLPPPETS